LKTGCTKTCVILALLMVGAASLFVYLFIQAHDYAVPLGNGYRYWGAKEGSTVIDRHNMSKAEETRVQRAWDAAFRSNSEYDTGDIGAPEVGPNVDSYWVGSGVITGHVSRPKAGEIDESNSYARKYSREGYFIIDIRSNTIVRGLCKAEWRKRLLAYGLHHEPKLLKPTGNRP